MINNLLKAVLICVLALIVGLGVFAIKIFNQQPLKPKQNDALVLRMAESTPRNHPSSQASMEFAKNVYNRTQGRINIEIYYKNELGNNSQAIEQLQFGGIAFAKVNLLDLIDKYQQLEEILIVSNLKNRDAAYDGFKNGAEKIGSVLGIENTRLLAIYYPELRGFAFNNAIKKENSFEDMKIGIQTSRILEKLVIELGATPITLIPNSEVRAINEGHLQGIEIPLVNHAYEGYTKILPFVVVNNLVYSSEVLLVSDVVLNTLELSERQIIYECALENIDFYNNIMRKAEENIGMDIFLR